jgi:uncharacterized protein (DUF2141 family)
VLDSKVMHNLSKLSKFFLIIFVFQSFFINQALSSHLKVNIIVDNSYNGQVIIEGYDRKYLFDSKNAPLFVVNRDFNDLNSPINLSPIPHTYIGLFVFIDLDGNKKFSLDFKGDPTEPYGFSLNPKKNYKNIKYEDLVFDTSLIDEILEISVNIENF